MADPQTPPEPQGVAIAHAVYLGLGANLGDRDATLRAAVAALGEPVAAPPEPPQPTSHPIVQVARVSSVYDTAPLLVTDQPRFHNIVVMGQTWLAPLPLLRALKQIETRLGRATGPRYGPRAIDLDILFYDDLVLRTPELTIPHAHIAERAFVLLPLAEIAPGLRHPTLGRSITDLAAALAGADAQRVGPL